MRRRREQTVLDEFKVGVGIGGAAILFFALFSPWLLTAGLLAAAIVGGRWWKNIGRFRHLKLADRKHFIETTEFLGGLFDFEWNGVHHHMLYLGNSQDGTIRYWYDDGYYYPQAVDNGEMYWDKCKAINDTNLRSKLDGFQEMGNEWPAYYNEVVMADKRKKALAQRVAQQEEKQRAASPSRKKGRKDAATATAAFLNEHPDYVKDLNETVEQLRKEIQGYCPTIDFESIQKASRA